MDWAGAQSDQTIESSPTPPSSKSKRTMPLTAPVTYKILAVILSSAAGLYTYLAQQHDNGGHPRHDAQHVAVEQKIAHVEQRVGARIEEHVRYEGARLHLIEQAVIRVETKMDHELRRHGHGFPMEAPPLEEIPESQRPGGLGDERRKRDGGEPRPAFSAQPVP